jgi:hypothetical protein
LLVALVIGCWLLVVGKFTKFGAQKTRNTQNVFELSILRKKK